MGQKFAAYNAQGAIIGFYDSFDSPLPSGVEAVEITDDEWQTCIASQPPYMVASGALVAPGAAQLLASAQIAQCALINAAYEAAIQTAVSFKSADGVTETFQADPASRMLVMQAVQGYTLAGATPAGFYWVAADNTHVPFTLADLQGLYLTILAQGWAAFQTRQTLKAGINAATATIASVQATNWP